MALHTYFLLPLIALSALTSLSAFSKQRKSIYEYLSYCWS